MAQSVELAPVMDATNKRMGKIVTTGNDGYSTDPDTGEETWDPDKSRGFGLRLVRRHADEERSGLAVDDPEFTVADIARMTKWTQRHVRRVLSDNGLGKKRRLNRRGAPQVIVKLSELMSLKSDIDLHRLLNADD